MPENVIILGASGMLGSMLVDWLTRDPELSVTATVRSDALASDYRQLVPEATWTVFDGESPDLAQHMEVLAGQKWLINAIGITKPYIHDDNAAEVERALCVNSLLPHLIARQAAAAGTRIIQIATDCVYSGLEGSYGEGHPHDALDVYGKTKSLGEVTAPHVHNLRCSIIGPEAKEHRSLLDWFLLQPAGAALSGFTNHGWNGVTTLHYARLCGAIIKKSIKLPSRLHIVPGNELTKYQLLNRFAESYNRPHVKITAAEAAQAIDRTLRTENPSLNRELWAGAGYTKAPTITDMVAELAAFDYRFSGGKQG